jgi:Fe-Mn family superoxide dismutase
MAYVSALDACEASLEKASLLKDKIGLQESIKFNGGGHINHSQFWKILAPSAAVQKGTGGVLNDGTLKDAINMTFGGLENLCREMSASSESIRGNGWVWLGFSPSHGKLEVVVTKDEDPLLSHTPIIGIDMWEHAYYLQVS